MWEYNMSSSDELYHHGIKGMKWGVRRYQNPDGTLTPAGKERYRHSSSDRGSKSNNNPISKIRNKPISSIDRVGMVGMNEYIAARLAMYAFVPIVSIIAATVRDKKNKKKQLDNLEKMKDNREFNTIKDVPKMSKTSPEQNMKKVNPGYPSLGTTMNCTFCTTAMVLREKGYKVNAKTSSDGWPSEELFQKTFNSETVKMNTKRTGKDVVDTLSSLGDGAYGNLCVGWKFGGGHSVFWKNVNGKVHIYDGQSGVEYDVSDPSSSVFLNNINPRLSTYNRLDNCDPTEYALAIVTKG